jgi:hypothetical protein
MAIGSLFRCGGIRLLLVFTIFAILFGTSTSQPVHASASFEVIRSDLDDWCESNDCSQVFREIIDFELALGFQPIEQYPVEQFDISATSSACQLNRPLQPSYFVLLIGPEYGGSKLKPLQSTKNDISYLVEALKERGISQERIRILSGITLTRAGIIEGMRETLACLRSGDQLLLAFDGLATTFPSIGTRPIEAAVKSACETNGTLANTGLCSDTVTQTESWKLFNDLYRAEGELFHKTSEGTHLVFLTNEADRTIYTDIISGKTGLPGLLAIEIANFVNRVRNLDADIFVLIDACHSGAARIGTFSAVRPWTQTLSTTDVSKLVPSDRAVRVTGRGQFAAFYATAAWDEAIERPMPQLGRVGIFSYSFTEAMRGLPTPTVDELAKGIEEKYAGLSRTGGRMPAPIVDTSSPGLVFMPAIAKTEPREEDIEILQPALKRSMESVAEDGKPLKLIARYTGTGKPFKAIIDDTVVDIDMNGQFTTTIDNPLGKPSITLRVMSRDFATLSQKVLRLKESDRDIILNSSGRKLALIIANQDYEDERFNDLRTPKADAAEIAAILKDHYGFSTTLTRGDGSALDLLLVNATRGAILRVLFDLNKQLTKDDELLIYYAGHGEQIEGMGSFWIPVDGKPGEYFDWVDSNDITAALLNLNPRAILLVSDSCYSGGLARGDEDSTPVSSEARDSYLAKARGFKTRQLIASGGEEPVEDGGGGAHSIFARALIEGLRSMPGPAFTASELVAVKVKPAVTNVASAVANRQIPDIHRMAKAGNEIGGEFIFVRNASPQ